MCTMKKFLFLFVIAAFSSGVVLAQKSAVKDAKRALSSNDLSEARTLIVPATTNPETAKDPETWKIYGDIGNKAFDNERTNQMLGKPTNNNVMFEGLLGSYRPYLVADSLGELPDAKGKVKNKFRKDISGILKVNQPFYSNAGIHFYEQLKDYKRAADCFEIFWNIPDLPIFAEEKIAFQKDSTFQIIKYYAILASIQGEDHNRAIRLLNRAAGEPFIENSSYKESDLFELLASEYIQTGDSAKYLDILNEGVQRFPQSSYFVNNLINIFIKKGENAKAMDFLDKAIANDPSNACDLNSVKGALLAETGDYENAETEYRKALAQDPDCERALEAIAVNYILQAQDLKEKTSMMTDRKQQAENDKLTVELYLKSLPSLERYLNVLKGRSAPEAEIKSAMMKLQNVYYNLSNLGVDKSKELKEIETQLGTE